jgi:hypothetical protein
LAESGTTSVVADSRKTQGIPIRLFLSTGNAEESLDLATHPLDLARGAHLKLLIPLGAAPGHLVLRLFDAHEKMIGAVPVLE